MIALGTPASAAPLPRYQIHHYPASLIDIRSAAGGRRFTLRPVLPQDDLLLAELVAGLSPLARCNRFFGGVNLSLAQLQRMSSVDYHSQLGLVVTTQIDGSEHVVADARYCLDDEGDEGDEAEFALMVDENWRRHGLGSWALQSLQLAAAQAGVSRLHGQVRCGNQAMLKLAQRCGFSARPDADDDGAIRVEHRLGCTPGCDAVERGGMWGWLSWLSWLERALPSRPAVLM